MAVLGALWLRPGIRGGNIHVLGLAGWDGNEADSGTDAGPTPDQTDLPPRTLGALAARIHHLAVARARDAIGWYHAKRGRKRRLGVSLRVVAILLTAVAGLHPLMTRVGQTGGTVPTGWLRDPVLPSILLALAALLVLLDRFGDMTSGWIRYMKTEMAIDQALASYLATWAAVRGVKPDGDVDEALAATLLERSRSLIKEVDRLVWDETAQWAAEFRRALAETEKAVEEARRRLDTGSVEVEVENWQELPGGRWTLRVGDEPERTLVGPTGVIAALPAGRVRVTACAEQGGRNVCVERAVEIQTGSTLRATVRLPPGPSSGDGAGAGGGGTEATGRGGTTDAPPGTGQPPPGPGRATPQTPSSQPPGPDASNPTDDAEQ